MYTVTLLFLQLLLTIKANKKYHVQRTKISMMFDLDLFLKSDPITNLIEINKWFQNLRKVRLFGSSYLKKFAAIFRKHVVKSVINFGKLEPQLGPWPPCIRTSMHAGATDCSRSSHRGSIPTVACYRGAGYWIRCETYVCFIHAQKERADGTPMIMGYRCCSTSRSFMGMQKTLRYWPRGKIRCLTRRVVRRGREKGADEFVFVSRLSLSLRSSTLFFYLSNPLSTVADVFSWSNRME